MNTEVQTQETATFRFRYKKDKAGNQRAPIEFEAVVPSAVDIIQAGGKGLKLLQEAIYETVATAYRGFFAENEAADASSVDHSKFTWEAIANQEREDRRSSAISPELWDAFAADYLAVMPAVTGKTEEAIAAAVAAYLKRFSIVRSHREVLLRLQDQLGLYIENSPNAENFSDILEVLSKKLDTYLNPERTKDVVALLLED